MQNVLVVFLNNGSHKIFYLKKDQEQNDAEQMAVSILARDNINDKDIRKMLYLPGNKMPPFFCHSYIELDGDNIKVNLSKILDSKIEQVRAKRDELLKQSDAEYLIALRRNKSELIKEIEINGQFLRDIPNKINKESLNTLEKIIKFNPFRNIVKVNIINPGENFYSIPQIIVDSPGNKYFGIKAILSAKMDGGKIVGVNIENNGSGYENFPKITISPENGAKIKAEIGNTVDF